MVSRDQMLISNRIVYLIGVNNHYIGGTSENGTVVKLMASEPIIKICIYLY